MKSIFLSFLCLFSLIIQAQNSNDADSLFSKSEDLLYQKPSESAKIAAFLLENSTDENDQIKSLLILSKSNLIQGNLNTSIDRLFQVFELSEHSKIQSHQTEINALLNEISMTLGMDNRGIYLISENSNPNKPTQQSWEEITNLEPYISLGKAKKLNEEGKFDQSIEVLNRLKPFDNKVQNVWLREDVYKLASQNYKELANWKDYKNYYKLYENLTDSTQTLKENARIFFVSKINQKQDEIIKVQTENHKKSIYGVLAAILGVWMSGFFLNRKLNFSKHSLEKLIQEQEEKQRLEAENKLPEGAGKIVIPDKTIRALLKKLDQFEKNEDYLDPSMSLNLLAENLKTNTKYLSEVINSHKYKNFHSYINDLRINYIIDKLKTNPIYLKYKVSHLAEESGFSSHSLFSTVFKQVTGFSPAAYIKNIKKIDSK